MSEQVSEFTNSPHFKAMTSIHAKIVNTYEAHIHCSIDSLDGGETCSKCGNSYRHEIHLRSGENKQQRVNSLLTALSDELDKYAAQLRQGARLGPRCPKCTSKYFAIVPVRKPGMKIIRYNDDGWTQAAKCSNYECNYQGELTDFFPSQERWVSVKERLPELITEGKCSASQAVEVFFPSHHLNYKVRLGQLRKTPSDTYWDCSGGAAFDVNEATHWRIPAPPIGYRCKSCGANTLPTDSESNSDISRKEGLQSIGQGDCLDKPLQSQPSGLTEEQVRQAALFIDEYYTWDKSGRGYIRRIDNQLVFISEVAAAYGAQCSYRWETELGEAQERVLHLIPERNAWKHHAESTEQSLCQSEIRYASAKVEAYRLEQQLATARTEADILRNELRQAEQHTEVARTEAIQEEKQRCAGIVRSWWKDDGTIILPTTRERIAQAIEANAPAGEPKDKENTMNHVMYKVPDDDPRMIVWKAYEKTESFTNSRNWALKTEYDDNRTIRPEIRTQNVEGSLWAAFLAGFQASGESIRDKTIRQSKLESMLPKETKPCSTFGAPDEGGSTSTTGRGGNAETA